MIISVKLNQFRNCQDYRIYCVNMHLNQQYGIFIAESQRFLWAKRPKRWGARRNGCFRRLIPCRLYFIYPATWNLSKSPATCKQLSRVCHKTLPEPNLCLKFCRQPMRVLLNEGSQTNLATCNLFPEAMMSFICQPLLHCWSHFWTPDDLLLPGSRQMFVILFCLKKKKKLKTEQSYKNWKFHIGEISGPCLALTHSPGLFLHKMGFEIMFDDYLVRKKACKTIKILILEGCHTGFFHDFGQKLEFSNLLCVTNLGVLYK